MRNPSPLLTLPSYDPQPLLEALSLAMSSERDATLAKALGIAPSVISRIRYKKIGVSAEILIRMHEVSGMSIRTLRTLMGDHRAFF